MRAAQAEGTKAGKAAAATAGGNGDTEWRVLTWQGRTHFDHTVVDDPPHMPGSRARLSVSVHICLCLERSLEIDIALSAPHCQCASLRAPWTADSYIVKWALHRLKKRLI